MSAPQAPNQYPSVDLAYPLAVQSYDFMVKRIDAMEARIHSTIGLGVSLTFAIPVALSAFDLQYRLWCVAAAFGVFLLAIFLGTFARLIGHIKLMSPTTLYNSWIQYTDEDFKRYFIYHAGEHMAANVSLLEKRHRLLRWVICLFVLGVFCGSGCFVRLTDCFPRTYRTGSGTCGGGGGVGVVPAGGGGGVAVPAGSDFWPPLSFDSSVMC